MANYYCPLSGYKGMWLFVLFDLPVKTKKDKHAYSVFRKELIREGFSQLQYSVYVRYFDSADSSQRESAFIQSILPSNGQVRIVGITDAQFGKMLVFHGKKLEITEKPPDQILLF